MRILPAVTAAAVCLTAGLAANPSAHAATVHPAIGLRQGPYDFYDICETAEDAFLATHRDYELFLDCFVPPGYSGYYFYVLHK